MDAKTPGRAVWTPRGLHNLAALARVVVTTLRKPLEETK
jgi:hypothetical protein